MGIQACQLGDRRLIAGIKRLTIELNCELKAPKLADRRLFFGFHLFFLASLVIMLKSSFTEKTVQLAGM
jgi:hypothetical protein